jgi:hypothetical protein
MLLILNMGTWDASLLDLQPLTAWLILLGPGRPRVSIARVSVSPTTLAA